MVDRNDPFAAVAALSGVGVAAAHARDAVDALLRQPAMRRASARVAAESAIRGARASAALEGAKPDDMTDPLVQGALRATAEVLALAGVWSGTPGQALARMHMLAAKDLVAEGQLGRPTTSVDRGRFQQVLRLAVAPTSAPAVVVAALVHGELATVRPFGAADGIIARVAERLVLVAGGVDTMAVSVPEIGHLTLARAYGSLLEAYSSGAREGVGAWVRHCCDAYARGAEEGITICRSLQ